MTFKVGDRVVYQNTSSQGVSTAVNNVGTVVGIERGERIQVMFDTPCWEGRALSNWVTGYWKWRRHEEFTPEQTVIRKCQDLTQRFKDRKLKTKSKPLPFPKEVKYV